MVNTSEAEVLKIALFKIWSDPSFCNFINSIKEIMVVITAMINFIFLAGSGLQLWSVYSESLNSTPLRGNALLKHFSSFQQWHCYVENHMLPIFILHSTFTAIIISYMFTACCLLWAVQPAAMLLKLYWISPIFSLVCPLLFLSLHLQ